MISSKNINKVFKGALAALPAIPYVTPYFTRRRSAKLLPLVLGGIGAALVGGLAAVMYLSPRTRDRAMDMAKNTYGKLETQITHHREKGSEGGSIANGMANESGIGTGYSSTGL
jgi:hypothetical protein